MQRAVIGQCRRAHRIAHQVTHVIHPERVPGRRGEQHDVLVSLEPRIKGKARSLARGRVRWIANIVMDETEQRRWRFLLPLPHYVCVMCLSPFLGRY
jgi:hypothetical protein